MNLFGWSEGKSQPDENDLVHLMTSGVASSISEGDIQYMIGSRQAFKKANKFEIYLDNEKLDEVSTFDYLSLRISNTLSWEYHVNRLCQRMYPKFGLLNRLSLFLLSSVLLRIYKQTVLPILDYGSTVWHECGIIQTKRVEKLQNREMRIILHQGRRKCTQDMRNELKLLTLVVEDVS